MKVKATQTLKNRIYRKIRSSEQDVFLTADFKRFSDEDQIIRALRELSYNEVLIKIGKGVYVKTRRSKITGKTVPAKPFKELVEETLMRLKIRWEPDELESAYRSGKSTQIPVNTVIKIMGRASRKLSYKNMTLQII
ncbi:MAG: hypothetical protein HY559_05225 [Gammaproteobacteria bacterium]|nr:hypothetical protein [Gammaproteobacteria bacterium]